MNSNFQLLNNVEKTYWYINKTLVNIPRNEIVIKSHIDENMLQVVELTYSYLINNDSEKVRRSNLKTLLIKLSLIDFFVLEIYKRGYIKKKKFESITNFILEIRKISYGLLRSEKSNI